MNKGRQKWIVGNMKKVINSCKNGETIELELKEPQIQIPKLWEMKDNGIIKDFLIISNRASVSVKTIKREFREKLKLKYKQGKLLRINGTPKHFYIFEDEKGKDFIAPVKKFLGMKLEGTFIIDCKFNEKRGITWIYNIEKI